MKVLMIGATGKYASHVIPELKQRGVTIRALVRQDKLDTACRLPRRGRSSSDYRSDRLRQRTDERQVGLWHVRVM
ncbi:NmrA family NAD(P)-binding protein [Chamaesiphon sp. GL140_3_metabinner_50]|uniref:NmrA family NAD(P)-binding protein n=1 Tax=Chamaesiphon sp. GL140_3_metabinner_50 TaxID=2970812 RepID=UPI0025CBE35C|nr:NmrA family NAD(P)-binding protein [Chamaesiphon sp. GL140_3_metabinner_50]